MAALQGQSVSPSEALAAATAETVLQLVAAANHRIKLLGFSASFDGASTTAVPVLVELVRQSTAGTSSANTPTKRDDSIADSLLTTARQQFTVEPTTGDIMEEYLCHPQQGLVILYPLGVEPICGGGDRIGIRVTAPAVVNCRVTMIFEE